MTTYVIHGKLGSGKGKFTVQKIREYLWRGCRVATNMDIRLEHLMGPQNRQSVIRIPDKPASIDLEAIGHGNPDSYDESRNGLLALDEAGSWFNSRQFMDADRKALMDWLLHARKLGWDVMLQVQDWRMIDKQFRDGLAEVLVRCIRADRIKIPMVGWMLGKRGKLPRFHVANYSLADIPGIVTDREWYRADDVNNGYDTRQIFQSNYEHGPYSMLSAWHVKGRHEGPPKLPWIARVFRPVSKPAPLPKKALVARLEALPPDRRVYWAGRLVRAGLI